VSEGIKERQTRIFTINKLVRGKKTAFNREVKSLLKVYGRLDKCSGFDVCYMVAILFTAFMFFSESLGIILQSVGANIYYRIAY
jgi:hypothetical protein